MTAFLETSWPILLAVLAALAGLYLLLPRARPHPALWGALACAFSLFVVGVLLVRAEVVWVEALLFYCFAGIAIVAGGVMIVQNKPVHAALSFALVVLSTCGLFLLQAAPFLMAATIVVYAGAIVVTFLFVIMLAQQSGASSADQRSREPFLATVAGMLLLGALLCVLHKAHAGRADATVLSLENALREVEPLRSGLTWQQLRDDLRRKGDKELKEEEKTKINKRLTDEEKKLENLFASLTMVHEETLALKEEKSLPEHQRSRPIQFYRAALDEASSGWGDLWAKEGEVTEQELAQLSRDFGKLHQTGLDLKLFLRGIRRILHPSPKLKLSDFSGTPPNVVPPPLDQHGRAKMPAENVAAIGKALFTDYLLAVELAATLLLVATIGAIAISVRRTEALR